MLSREFLLDCQVVPLLIVLNISLPLEFTKTVHNNPLLEGLSQVVLSPNCCSLFVLAEQTLG